MKEQLDNEIVHRWQGGQSLRGIARDLSVTRWRVTRVIRRHQAVRSEASLDSSNSALPAARRRRGSKLDAFQSAILQLLKRYSHITATRVFEELRRQG
jgi:IS30 family transposase